LEFDLSGNTALSNVDHPRESLVVFLQNIICYKRFLETSTYFNIMTKRLVETEKPLFVLDGLKWIIDEANRMEIPIIINWR
jgi:hypothetical protein